MEKTFRTMLHGFMKSHAVLKNMCKKTRKTSAGQNSMAAKPHGFSACQAQKGLWIVLNGEVSI
jgi:hypothetical protein